MVKEIMSTSHTHKTEDGIFVKCYHSCKSILFNWQFWLGSSLGFPLEHALWEKVPPFKYVAHWMGL